MQSYIFKPFPLHASLLLYLQYFMGLLKLQLHNKNYYNQSPN